MPKHVVKVPPLRAGRRVSWTFEVSAAVAGEKSARSKKAPSKRQRTKSTAKKPLITVSDEPAVVLDSDSVEPSPAPPVLEAAVYPAPVVVEESIVPIVMPQVAPHPAARVRLTDQRAVALAGFTLLVVGAL